jgi:hypothetical protein
MSEAVAVTVVAVVVVIAVVVARAHNCQTFPVGWKEGNADFSVLFWVARAVGAKPNPAVDLPAFFPPTYYLHQPESCLQVDTTLSKRSFLSLWVAKLPISTSYNSLFKGLSTASTILAQVDMAPQSNPTGFEMKEFVSASTSKKWRAKDPWTRA